ncbi:MAG: hypothetical protein ACOZAR_00270 [Patescibacteria group bacterium]
MKNKRLSLPNNDIKSSSPKLHGSYLEKLNSKQLEILQKKSKVNPKKESNQKFTDLLPSYPHAKFLTNTTEPEEQNPFDKMPNIKKIVPATLLIYPLSMTPALAKTPAVQPQQYPANKATSAIYCNQFIPKGFPVQSESINNPVDPLSLYDSRYDTKTGENLLKIDNNIQNYDQYNKNIDQFSEKIVEVQINCSYGDYIKNIIIQKLNDLGYKIINGSKTNPNIPTLIVTNTPINNSGNLGVNTQFNNVGINYNSGSSYTNTLYFYYSYKDQRTGENLIQIIGSSEGNSSNWNVGTYTWLQNFGINVNLCNNDPALKATQEAANNLNPSILASIPATTFNNPSNTYQTNNTNQYPSQQYSTQYSNYTPNNTSTVENQTIPVRKINLNNGFDPYLNNTDILYTDYAGWTEIILLDKNGKAQETIKKSFQATPQAPFNIMEIVNQEFKDELEKTSSCNFKIKFYLTNSTNPYSSNYVSIKKTK